MKIVSREEWGAVDPTRIETTTHRELYLHHTVGSGARDKDGDGDLGDDYTKDVQTYHMSKGWDDIAYNFLIDPDGLEVYEGQGWGREPNAQGGHNEGTFAVAVMGDFRTKQPAPELLDKIAELIQYGQELGHLPTDAPLQGHRDAPGSEGNTCPGDNLYAKLREINERIENVALSQDDKDFIIAAVRGDNVEQTESVWNRYFIRDSQGNPVPLVRALEAIYRKLETGTAELDPAEIADQTVDRIKQRL